MPRATILWVGAITLLIAIYYTWQEVQRTSICDTTYIYEGYADVALPSDITAAFPRYKLVRYNDNAPLLQHDIKTLRRNHRPVPLLFVHGHLGSPQQMRSMASETSREVIRRYTLNKDTWNLWIDWYVVNFNEEPSAFEPRLLEEQALFVAACLRHLSTEEDKTSTSSSSAPLLLVGYSMGGLVVESALQHLHNDSNLLQRLALVLTLGSPRHHLPRLFLTTSSTIRNSSATILVDLPPSIHILAGPGDLMIPGLSSWASIWKNKKTAATAAAIATATTKTAAAIVKRVLPLVVQVDMDDVPGVWCTASHKGMISCNQLVRQTVPLLIDAAARATSTAAAAEGLPATAATTAAAAGALKLTTSLLKGIPETVSETEELLNELQNVVKNEQKLLEIEKLPTTRCRHPDTIKASSFIFTEQLRRDDTQTQEHQCYLWNAEQDELKTVKKGSLFFLFSGLVPERDFQVRVEFFSKNNTTERARDVDVSGLTRPLPGMMEEYPSAIDAVSKRPWNVILNGVDWMKNSTRILRLPFGTDTESFSKIKLELNKTPKEQQQSATTGTSISGPPPTFIAQIVPDSAKIESVHIRPFHSFYLAAGKHPLALQLATTTHAATAAGTLVDQLSKVIIGHALPVRIKSAQTICSNVELATETAEQASSQHAPEHSVALLVAVEKTSTEENVVVVGDLVRKAHLGLSLWHPSVLNRDVWLISDPRCSYTLSMVWDVGPWISYTLRYHAYAIIPLAFALSLFNLQNTKNNFAQLAVPLLLLLPALSSVWPEHATTLLGRPPWLPLSMVDVLLLGCVAYTVLQSLEYSVLQLQKLSASVLNLFFWPSTTTSTPLKRSTSGLLKIAVYIAVGISSGVHPAMPALLGVAVLQISLAATTTTTSLLKFKQAWLVTQMLGSLPAGIWLFGWIASGRSHMYPLFSLERVCMLIQGAHCCTVAVATTAATAPTTSFSSVIFDKMTLFLAVFVAFSGLWGSLHVVIPALAALCAWELVLKATRVSKRKEKRR